MPEIPEEAIARARRVKDRLLAYPWVQKVYLYGSFARGTYRGDSDLDLAVFVVQGHPCGLREYTQVCRAARGEVFDIQIQLFSSDELDDPCGIVEEITAFGVDITGL